MVETHGLTHIALDVRDPERSLQFYAGVFGVRRRGEFAPGCPDAFVSDPDGYEVEIWFE